MNIKNIINVEFDEKLIEKNDPADFEFGKTASECLEKMMNRVCINSRHMKKEIYVTFTDNEGIAVINREHRDIDKPTDVLSFPLLNLYDGRGEISEYDRNPENGCVCLGDIVVSVDKIREQAREYGHSETRETAFLVCHGLLHLLGYDHIEKEREEVMMPLAEKLLTAEGYLRK